jgi:hypothetical protein
VNIETIITGQGPVTDLYREYYIALLDQMIRELWVEIGAGTLPRGPKKFSKRFYELQGTFARGPRWGHVTMDMFPFLSGDSQLSEPDKLDQNDEPVEPTAQKRKRETEGTVDPSLQAPALQTCIMNTTSLFRNSGWKSPVMPFGPLGNVYGLLASTSQPIAVSSLSFM